MDAVHDRMSQTHAMVAINDRDVADLKLELRAHRKTLEALRETQLEQAGEMREGFATVLAAVQALADRLPEESAA